MLRDCRVDRAKGILNVVERGGALLRREDCRRSCNSQKTRKLRVSHLGSLTHRLQLVRGEVLRAVVPPDIPNSAK